MACQSVYVHYVRKVMNHVGCKILQIPSLPLNIYCLFQCALLNKTCFNQKKYDRPLKRSLLRKQTKTNETNTMKEWKETPNEKSPWNGQKKVRFEPDFMDMGPLGLYRACVYVHNWVTLKVLLGAWGMLHVFRDPSWAHSIWTCLFSSPEQCLRRAIVLPPVLAAAAAA